MAEEGLMNKILVVDDDRYVCKKLSNLLRRRGYKVMEALSGDDAVEMYGNERPDAVLLDILMPGKDGFETLSELKALDPEIRVIMVTAVLEEDAVEQAMAEGTFDYITKPVDPDYLELSLQAMFAMN